MTEKNVKLVPLEQVLNDMDGDDGAVSWAARDYYYRNYATLAQKKQMDRKEKRGLWISCVLISAVAALVLFAVIWRWM